MPSDHEPIASEWGKTVVAPRRRYYKTVCWLSAAYVLFLYLRHFDNDLGDDRRIIVMALLGGVTAIASGLLLHNVIREWRARNLLATLLPSLLTVAGIVLAAGHIHAISQFPPHLQVIEYKYDFTAPPIWKNRYAVGPDGDLWFIEYVGDRVGKITPDGVVTGYGGITPEAHPSDITVGPDGNVWFTEPTIGRIGKITPEGRVTEYGDGLNADTHPDNITVGPDGNLWFTGICCINEAGRFALGKITTEGVITLYNGRANDFDRTYFDSITTGPDGNLWVTASSRIGKIGRDGVMTMYGDRRDSLPLPERVENLTTGPDGNLWFIQGHEIGKITPDGVITKYATGGNWPERNFAFDRGGNLWFVSISYHKLGRLTPEGVITDHPVALPYGEGIFGIAADRDGNLWIQTNVGFARILLPATTTTRP